MNRLFAQTRNLLLCAAVVLPLAAQAQSTAYLVPFDGSGNIAVFDATAGSGGWVGSLTQSPDGGSAPPLSFVSFVLFDLNQATRALSGTFEFTTTDLASSLNGNVAGFSLNPDFLGNGGRLLLNYTVAGGTGQFAGANGFATSQLSYDVSDPFAFDNYTETGLLAFAVAAVPEPASMLLMAAGLLGVGLLRRKYRS